MALNDKDATPSWLPKLSLPHLGGAPGLKERQALEQLQGEVRQLRSALRWSMAFIVNVALGLEITEGAKVETAQIRQGIKEGLKRSQVPRGVLTSLDDVLTVLKEWDLKTFRVEQDLEVCEKTPEQIVLKQGDCPAVFRTMRRSAQFLIDRASTDFYLHVPSPLDFLCVPHTLCRSVLISWLSDDRFQVEELPSDKRSGCGGVCQFAVKRAIYPVRRSREAGQNPAQT